MAWHTELKRMFSAEEMGKDQLTLSVDGRGFVNVSGEYPERSIFAGDKMIPFQFTGVLDKNGKEIYAGHILKDDNGSLAEVKWRSVSTGFQLDPNTAGWWDLVPSAYEIVGHIYENPGMMEEMEIPSKKQQNPGVE